MRSLVRRLFGRPDPDKRNRDLAVTDASPARHPFGDRCPHGVQFLDQCDDCPGGWQPANRGGDRGR